MDATGLAVAAATWGVVMGVSPLLQIRRMLRQRSSRDVSIGYFAVLQVGFVLWISYGIAAQNPALIVPNSVALLIGVSTVVVAVCQGRGHRTRRDAPPSTISPLDGRPSPGAGHG